MSDFLVTVAIPTKNRQFYANLVTRETYNLSDKIQIVISDNSDNDSLREMLSDLIDGNRVIYNYISHRIGVVENYDNAAKMSTGEFFCSIGDDDIVLPTIIELALWMKKNSVDAVRTSRNIYYQWPSHGSKHKNGFLAMGPYTANCYRFNPEKSIIKMLEMGCQGYLNADIAGTYHALVSYKLMNKAKKIAGFYYSGLSPDIYSATCLSLVKNIKAFSVDFPISVPGICPNSASYRALYRNAVSSVEDAIITYGKNGFVWHNLVPRYYTPQTTWATTMLEAIENMGRAELIENYYNKKNLVNMMYSENKAYRKEILSVLTEEEISMIEENFEFNTNQRKCKLYKVMKVIYNNIIGEQKRCYNVKNVHEAEEKIISYLNQKRIKKKWLRFVNTKV